MKHRVDITGPATRDVEANHRWWSENRDKDQADRWYLGVIDAMYALADTADRYNLATEEALRAAGIKQASFGLGRKPTHRIVYGIVGEEVVIYRVRAFKQDAIGLDDLTSG